MCAVLLRIFLKTEGQHMSIQQHKCCVIVPDLGVRMTIRLCRRFATEGNNPKSGIIIITHTLTVLC